MAKKTKLADKYDADCEELLETTLELHATPGVLLHPRQGHTLLRLAGVVRKLQRDQQLNGTIVTPTAVRDLQQARDALVIMRYRLQRAQLLRDDI